jgi:PIN domain nuclease of toxin-antitoxin system
MGNDGGLVVLDTHAFVWMETAPDRLGSHAKETIASGVLAICTISVHEIAYLVARRRIEFDRPLAAWIGGALRLHQVNALAPNVSIALRAGSLHTERFPRDPTDRLIYATALEHSALLVSADRHLRAADPERVVW